MTQQERDVIVVGAGPAGATTATILAQKGYDVLLLDRKPFPRDKACGDGVPVGALRRLYRLGMADKFEAAVARGEMYPVEGMRLVSPRGHVVEADFIQEGNLRSYVAPRLIFDAIIQEHAVESGAEFRAAAVKGPLVEDGRVTGVSAQQNGAVEQLRAKIVVGADGVTSVIARQLRPKREQHHDDHRAIALRAYLQGIDIYPSEVEFFLYDEILPGYAWIFPTAEDAANIGLGMRLDIFRKTNSDLNVMLENFLKLPMIRQRLKPGYSLEGVRTWQLNFGSQKGLHYAFDGAVLVGDAAGLINPITGGGIHNSVISAELAAETIDQALKMGDTSRRALSLYEELAEEEMGPSMRRSYFMQRWLLRFPRLVDFLIMRARENHGIVQTFLDKL